MSTGNNILSGFRASSPLSKLIIVNIVVFLIFNLTLHLGQYNLAEYTAVYSGPLSFLKHFWGVFTYMFTHVDLGHVFSNLLWLFFMGQIFSMIIGEHRLFFVYMMGGLCGALLYFVSALFIPGISGLLIGASASVMAISVAVGFYAPNMPVNVFLFGEVKLKWVVLVSFVAFSIVDFSINQGGKISHIGGAVFGMIYGLQLKKRNDIGKWFADVMKPSSSKLKVVHAARMSDEEYNYSRSQNEKTLDELLEKIHKSGYDSLSKKDKETLNRLSKNH